MQKHALETIDAGKDDQVSGADETLLRILAEKRANLETPTAGEILKAAQESEPNIFRTWTAKAVSNALRRYTIHTAKAHGRKLYRGVTMADLTRIQSTYGLALGLREEASAGDEC